MLKQWLAVVALSAMPAGYGLTLCAAPAASSRSLEGSRLLAHPGPVSRVALPGQAASPALAPVTQPRPPVSRTVDPAQPLHAQMRVLEHVARKDMLLYTGHFAPAHHASSQQLVPLIAFTLPGAATSR